MRKFVVVMFVAFTASIFAIASTAQRRGRARGRAPAAARASAEPPQSVQIVAELGGPQGIQWGWSHDQVVDYYRRGLAARYQPRLRNQGQVEQDRLMQERDRQLQTLRDSYITFDGRQSNRRWDTSFLEGEYTHSNGETMLVYEDPSTGNREFFFFFNDHLWKRFQARAVPAGSGMDYDGFVTTMETLFGHGLHIPPAAANASQVVAWQDGTTRLHVIDQSTFYNAFCLVYEEKATLGRLADLRHNAPTKVAGSGPQKIEISQPNVGNVDNDNNADIVDRLTGKMRRTQQAPTTPAAGSTGSGSTGSTPPAGSHPASPPQDNSGDQLRGL